jgi:hypothetical protein
MIKTMEQIRGFHPRARREGGGRSKGGNHNQPKVLAENL